MQSLSCKVGENDERHCRDTLDIKDSSRCRSPRDFSLCQRITETVLTAMEGKLDPLQQQQEQKEENEEQEEQEREREQEREQEEEEEDEKEEQQE